MTTTSTALSKLPEPAQRRNISEAQWLTLRNSLYPGAKEASIILVWDYCSARKLDPLKKPCHIVPMEVRKADTNTYEWRDVVMPGIYELRTTAQRTGEYVGHSKPEYGPVIDYKGVKVPEHVDMTVYRWHTPTKQRVEFPVRVYFREVVATTKDGKPNARWMRAPVQMMVKCLEAAGLREAFPDELGGEHVEEEMAGQRALDVSSETVPTREKPDGYQDWIDNFAAALQSKSTETLTKMWTESKDEYRTYLAETDAATFDAIKAKATETPAP